MAYDIQQSTTQQKLLFLMVLSSDHITGATGKTVTVTISKAGGTFATPSGAVTELANGWYQVAANATDTNTLGPILLHATEASCDPTDIVVANVVAYNPQDSVRLGLTAMPNAAAGANGGLPLSVDTSGRVDVLKINGTSQTARDIGASVLLSAGTGTGQLDFTSGVVKANLAQILGTALTETAGQIAAAFKKFFNIATPASTMDSLTLVATATNVTNGVTVSTNNDKSGYTTSDWTTQLTESYRANGAAPTPAQAVHEILAHLGEAAISGTTKTVKKLDHTTSAETFTLDSATTPTSITRAT